MREDYVGITQASTLEERPDQDPLAQETAIGGFRGRFIRISTMRPALRRLTILGLALLVSAAGLVAATGLPQMQLVPEAGSYLPLIAAVGLVPLLALCFTYLVTAALRAQWGVRWLVTCGVASILLYPPDGPIHRTNVSVLQLILTIAQLLLIGLLVVVTMVISVGPILLRRGAQAMAGESRRTGLRFLLVGAGFLTYYGLDFIWSSAAPGNLAAEDQFAFLRAVIEQLVVLTILVIGVLLWSSPSFMEVGESAGHAVIALVWRLRKTWLLAPITLLLAGWIVLDCVLTGGASGASLFTTLVLLAALAGVTWVARFRRAWPAHVPPLGIFLGVAFIYAGISLSAGLIAVFEIADPANYWLNLLIPGISLSTSLALGIFLLARGRATGQSVLLATGLFLLYTWIFFGPTNLALTLQAAGWDISPPPAIEFANIRLVAAVLAGTLVIGVLIMQRSHRPLYDAVTPLATALLALAGLEAIQWILRLLAFLGRLNTTEVGIGLFFLVTVVWDVVTSGKEVTNGSSAGFPRDARVLLYLGYSLVGATLLLYVTAARGAAAGHIATSINDIQAIVVTGGALFLGIPLVALSAVMRLGSWRLREQLAHTVTQLPPETASAQQSWAGAIAQGAIASVGVLVTLGLVLALVAHGRPPVETSTPTPTPLNHMYQTQSPGPRCDAGTASWLVIPANTAITCTANGTVIDLSSVAPQSGSRSATLAFIPPEQTFANDYSLSVRVDFQGQSGTCSLLETRVTSGGEYVSAVCASGGWFLDRLDGSVLSTLASGVLSHPLSSATVVATARGSMQTLALNGAVVGSASDATYGTTSALSVELLNAAGGAALLSDFIYTPLSR
jgi:hypothetical protein